MKALPMLAVLVLGCYPLVSPAPEEQVCTRWERWESSAPDSQIPYIEVCTRLEYPSRIAR